MFELGRLYNSKKSPIVTAHRGFSGKFPENTMPAFEAAYNLGVDFIEFDVRESADGVLVVLHDSTVDRTTNGSGEVKSLKFEDIT